VLKEVTQKKSDRVEIAFKDFRERGLEEPTRWLQELYPIDEILAKGLSIPKRNIQFKKDSRMKEVYRARAWRMGKVIYENRFSPEWIEQPYLISFPRIGKVHPCTGWVRMKIDGEEVVDQRVSTGIERIWEVYQKELLPFVAKKSNQILLRHNSLPKYPIFEELRFDIYFDYPMEILGVDEERISPLEALHEDLYFVTLDFFSHWMKKKGLKGISLGRVLPIVHSDFRGKKGKATFTLVHRSEETFSPSVEDSEIGISLNGIFFNKSKVWVELFVKAEKNRGRRRLRRLRLYTDRGNNGFHVKEIQNRNIGLSFDRLRPSFKGTEFLKGQTTKRSNSDETHGYQEGIEYWSQKFSWLPGREEGPSRASFYPINTPIPV
jgi:hypothetical protein